MALDQASPVPSPTTVPMSSPPPRSSSLSYQSSPHVNGAGAESPYIRNNSIPHINGNSTPLLLSEAADETESEAGRLTPLNKAASGGKSGRVIERLMGEVDRLTRELKLATVKCEEEQRRSELARSAVDSLRVSNANLEAICDTTKSALDRKDRRIETLRSSLESEKTARHKAQTDMEEITKKAKEEVKTQARELATCREATALAETHYEAVRESVKRLDKQRGGELEKLRRDVEELKRQRGRDQRRFEAIDEICAQMRADVAKAQAANLEMEEKQEAYFGEAGSELSATLAVLRRQTAETDRKQREMDEVLGGMRYVMNLQSNVRGA